MAGPSMSNQRKDRSVMVAFEQGVAMARRRGTCVLVGLPPGELPVPLFDVVATCITLRGSFVGTRRDMIEALAFAAAGKVKADIELQPLSALNQVFERLQHGDVAARVVLDFVGVKGHKRLPLRAMGAPKEPPAAAV
jgi:propanol-preferring alcohol dehydrogenase